MKDFHILLQKFIDQEITKEEHSQDPILKKEYDKHRLAILGIKMKPLRDELKDIMKDT